MAVGFDGEDVFHLWIPGHEHGSPQATLCGLRLAEDLLLLAARSGDSRCHNSGVCPRCLEALGPTLEEVSCPAPGG
jgi:hypothetical protein